METIEGQLGRLLSSRRELGKTVVIAALFAFAISTASGLLVGDLDIPRWSLWVAAATLIVVGLWALANSVISKLRFANIIEAAVFLDPEKNASVSIKGYSFSEERSRILRAVKAENSAIYSEWERDPLSKRRQRPAKRDLSDIKEPVDPKYIAITRVKVSGTDPQSAAGDFLEEAALYLVLEILSTHLSTHFNDEHENPQIQEFSRNDFPEFLLKNRVLNLLSTPIEERPIFLKAFPDPDKRPEGEIFSLWGSDGAVFSRFDLNLPVGSKLTHRGRNGLSISTRRLSIDIDVQVTNSPVLISRIFASHYVGMPFDHIDSRKILIRFSGKVKPWYLLSPRGWELYSWMDSFSEKLKDKTDFSVFLNYINWHNIIEPTIFTSFARKRSIEYKKSHDNVDDRELLDKDKV